VTYARRETRSVSETWVNKTPVEMTIVYLVAYPMGKEPRQMLVPRKVKRV
jgi:hypothetical protein